MKKIYIDTSYDGEITREKHGDNVFIGPHTCFTNDLYPRINKSWTIVKTNVQEYVSIGANCTIVCGITILLKIIHD